VGGPGRAYVLDRGPRSLLAQSPDILEHEVEALALDELHGVVEDAVLFADTEDRHDVRVVQPRRRPGLALEALPLRRVQQRMAGQDLEGNVASQ